MIYVSWIIDRAAISAARGHLRYLVSRTRDDWPFLRCYRASFARLYLYLTLLGREHFRQYPRDLFRQSQHCSVVSSLLEVTTAGASRDQVR
jgi:hypothetical protein